MGRPSCIAGRHAAEGEQLQELPRENPLGEPLLNASWKLSEGPLRKLPTGSLGHHVREIAQTQAEPPALALAADS